MPLLIEDTNKNIIGSIFHCIVLVTYQNFLDKENTKNIILCAYLIDNKEKITIRMFVPTYFIEQNETKMIANVGVFISQILKQF